MSHEHAAIASDHLIASEKRPRQVTDHIQIMSTEEHGKDILFVFVKNTKNSSTPRELKYYVAARVGHSLFKTVNCDILITASAMQHLNDLTWLRKLPCPMNYCDTEQHKGKVRPLRTTIEQFDVKRRLFTLTTIVTIHKYWSRKLQTRGRIAKWQKSCEFDRIFFAEWIVRGLHIDLSLNK